MSFILNALRKSEQERQSLQPEAINDRIHLPQMPQKHSKTTKLLVFLIIGNVLVLGGIVWFIKYNPVPNPAPDLASQALVKPLTEQKEKPESKVLAKAVQPESSPSRTEPETSSIAELIDAQDAATVPVAAKPISTKKPAIDLAKSAVIARKAVLPPAAPEIVAVAKAQPTPLKTIAVKKDLPFLTDLPAEFRQAVPKFSINVFVYSEHPDERFVMIDMVKYKPGQQIKDMMLLKEILPGSLVVVYQNQAFQIVRP